jgi:AcrR family transcriptional regulator
MSAEDRKEQVIRAAVTEFSIRGLEGTSTSDIAKRVGVSQPYLFRLFPTKKDLFIAACERGVQRVRDAFTAAAEGTYGQEALVAMGGAYQDLLNQDREVLMMQLQQYAACHDPEVQAQVRGCMQGLWQHVENLSGTSVEARVDFFAKGMMCNAIAAMGRADVVDPLWTPILDIMRDATGSGPSAAVGDLRSPEDEAAYAEYVESAMFANVTKE